MDRIKVCIVEDYHLFREGIKLILNSSADFEVVAEFNNGKELTDVAGTLECDVILMDITMPVMDGYEATKIMSNIRPEIPVLVLSMLSDENSYHNMVSAGAKGFLLKECKAEELFRAIKSVAIGDNYFSQELLRKIIFTHGNQKSGKAVPDISDRELEVLELLCKGLTNVEIAEKLFISQRTVEGHRASMLKKTDTKNTISLILFAIRNGIIKL